MGKHTNILLLETAMCCQCHELMEHKPLEKRKSVSYTLWTCPKCGWRIEVSRGIE